MSDAFAQSVWAGNESSPLLQNYSNTFAGAGFMSYSGLAQLHCNHPPCKSGLTATVEFSNVAATNVTSSGSGLNQTYFGGSFFSGAISHDSSTGSEAANATYSLGKPDGLYSLLWAPNLGNWAWLEDSFTAPYDGTIAMYGY